MMVGEEYKASLFDTRRHYDLDAAKERALLVAGLGNGEH
jgi:hypothetical protein